MEKIRAICTLLIFLIINQLLYSQSVDVSPTSLNFDAYGGTKTFNVTAISTGWGFSDNWNWLAFSRLGFYGSASVNVTCAQNTTTNVRIAYITIGSKIVTITQAGAQRPATPIISSTVDYNNGSTTLYRSGSPPTGISWYWQTMPDGTNRASNNYASSYTVINTGTYYLRAYDSGSNMWSASSASKYVTVNTCIEPSPFDLNICQGVEKITAITTSNNVSSHRWYHTQTGGSYIDPAEIIIESPNDPFVSSYRKSGGFSDGEIYYVSSVCGQVETNRSTISVNILPIVSPSVFLSSVPEALLNTSTGVSHVTLCSGSNIKFTATPTSQFSNPTYQWKVNGDDIIGETSTTYSTNLFNNGDVFSVRITANGSCQTSNTSISNIIQITVPERPSTPTISSDIIYNNGSTTISRLGNPPNGVYWYWQTTPDGMNRSTNNYAPGYTVDNPGTYYLRAYNPICNQWSTSSASKSVTIVTCMPPQSYDLNICQGDDHIRATTLSNGVTLHRWYLTPTGGNNIDQNEITIESSNFPFVSNYSKPGGFSGGEIYYVSSVCGQVETNRSTISVNILPIVSPSVFLSSVPEALLNTSTGVRHVTLCPGSNITFTATPTSQFSNPTYQWKVNGDDIIGETSTTYSTNLFNNGDVFSVRITANGSCQTSNTSISNSIQITVPVPVPPSASIELGSIPQTTGSDDGNNFNICKGSQLKLTAKPDGFNYSWLKNGAPIEYGNSQILTIADFWEDDYFTVRISGFDGCYTSSTDEATTIPLKFNNPQSPTIDFVEVPYNTSISLITDAPGENEEYRWYTQPEGGERIVSTPLELNEEVNYYVSTYNVATNCESILRSKVIILPESINQNYIKTISPKVDSTNLADEEDCNINYFYFNGLGIPIQQVGVGQSPTGADIIQIIGYDDFGRKSTKYMPYTQAGNNGAFIDPTKAITDYKAFYGDLYDEGENNYTAVTAFDGSPLNRPVEQSAPGKDWQIGASTNATVKFAYETNTSTITRWDISGEGLSIGDYEINSYDPSTLYVNTITDENQMPSKEYKNLQGQVVLTESFDGNGDTLLTYYIYDDLSLLRCVVPPEAAGTIDDKYCYFYRYDDRNRMVEKKIPGAEAIYLVYDKRDRLVLTQDGNMRVKNEWMYTKYDKLNRPKETGIYTHNNEVTQDFMQYTVVGSQLDFPGTTTDEMRLSETFYDTYAQLPANMAFSKANKIDDYKDDATNRLDQNNNGYFDNANGYIKGQITYTKTSYEDNGKKWLTTVNYYDDKYRVIQTIADNHLVGKDIISNKYDFVGKVMETKQVHTTTGNADSIVKRFAYDDYAARLLTVEMSVNGGAFKEIAHNKYNELGQLEQKKTHKNSDNTYLITTNFGYNIRGWVTSMGNIGKNAANLFNLSLGYNSGPNPQYNGNISSMGWNSSKLGALKMYNFTYDPINRLTNADFTGSTDENYTTSYAYDKNGNITTLVRSGFIGSGGFGIIDNLGYAYHGNRLIGVNDTDSLNNQAYGFKDNGRFNVAVAGNVATHEYLYDANGNMVTDLNKGINEIRYNYLNLPDFMLLANNKAIDYLYDAAGIKLQQKVYGNGGALEKVVDYVGGFVYENGALSFILTDDGRLVPNGSGFDYEYHIKDHLGNNRITVKDSLGFASIQQEDHYYPFGLQLSGQSYRNPAQKTGNKYLFAGKELQDDLDLMQYDFDARSYDPQLIRFKQLDPLGQFASGYVYAGNNPMNNIDPSGMWSFPVYYDGVLHHIASDGKGDDGGDGDDGEEGNEKNSNNNSGADPPKWFSTFLDKVAGDFYREYGGAGVDKNLDTWYGEDGCTYAIDENDNFYRIGFYSWTMVDELPQLANGPIPLGLGAASSSAKNIISAGFGGKLKKSIVYIAKEGKKVVYVGITNNFAIRKAVHLRKKGIHIDKLLENLSRYDARAVEQVLINAYSLGKKGGSLLNEINSIATKNPVYERAIKRGIQVLKSHGINF